MDENFEEKTIPYADAIEILKEQNWNGYLVSEYEGADKDKQGFVSEQLRRQHIMMKRIIGD